MKPIRALAGACLLATLSNAHAYDVVKRYKIIDDKLKTEAMMRPIGHDFFLDVSAAMNKNLMDVIDEVKEVLEEIENLYNILLAVREEDDRF